MLNWFRRLGRLRVPAETVLVAGSLTVAAWASAAFVADLGYGQPWPLPGRPIHPVSAAIIATLAVGVACLRGRLPQLALLCPSLVLGSLVALVANRIHADGTAWSWPGVIVRDYLMLATGAPSVPASDWNVAAYTAVALGTILSTVRSSAASIAVDVLAWVPISIGVATVSLHVTGIGAAVWDQSLTRPGFDMAVALCCLGLALGITNGRQRGGAFAVLLSRDSAGWISRRYLTVTLLAPVAVVWAGAALVRAAESIDLLPGAVTVMFTMVGGVTALSLAGRVRLAERRVREAKTRAEEAKERLNLALDVGNIGTYETDLGTRQVHRSDTLYRMYGLEKREPEISAEHWRALIHPDDRAWVLAARDALGEDAPEYRRTHRIVRRSDGVVRYVTVAARWLPGGALGAGRIVGAVSDITSHMEAALAAERASDAKSRLMAGIGHDLRQPLQGMLLHLDVVSSLLERTQGVPDAARSSLAACSEATASLSKMLDGMLAMARSGTDQEPIRLHDMSVAHLLRDLEREYSPRAAIDRIDLRIRVSKGDELHARTDPALLERVLRNLIENAIKHTPKGGRILVLGRARAAGPLVEVRDSGRGIPEAKLGAIWDERRQVSPSDQGSGMGLATVRRLATRMGWGFGADSLIGRGSRFWIRIPTGMEDEGRPLRASRAYDPSAQAAPPEAEVAVGLPLVMLVEDEEALRQGLASLIRRLGAEVVEAGDTCGARREAHSLLAQGRVPDAILSDYRLPGESGIKVIEAVRTLFRAPIPAILLTADTGEEVEGATAAIGAKLFRKPLGSSSIAEALRSTGLRLPEGYGRGDAPRLPSPRPGAGHSAQNER